MNKSRKWSEKNREMFRQMAHLKCLGQGISNFNETLDLAQKLWFSSQKKGGGEIKKGK